MPRHYVTFPNRYRHEHHPFFGALPSLPDYYGIVHAQDYRRATDLTRSVFGDGWSMLYIQPPEQEYAPLGSLFTLRPDTAGLPVLTFSAQDHASRRTP